MPTEKEKMLQFIAQRDDVIERLDEILAIGIAAKSDRSKITEFKIRFAHLEKLYTSFEALHLKIINSIAITEDGDLKTQRTLRKRIDAHYFQIKTLYEDLGFQDDSDITHVDETERVVRNVRLPKIDIPLFHGNLKDWPSFRDLFKSLIDDHSQLTNIEKFQYLLSVLGKEPLAIVKSVAMTGENYPIAFKNLMQRYDNKRLLAVSYWRELVDFPKVDKENPITLRKLYNVFTENLAALDVLEFPVDQWDFPLFNILLEKLDLNTRTQFELSQKAVELPTYSDLTSFIANHCKALDQIDVVKYKNSPSTSKSSSGVAPKPPTRQLRSSFVVNTDSCALCKGPHSIYTCSSLLELDPYNRYRVAKDYKLCLSCLRSSHQLSACPSTSVCRTCKSNRHHTLLHFDGPPRTSHLSSSPSNLSNSPKIRSNSPHPQINPQPSTSTQSSNSLVANTNRCSTVLLSTTEILVIDTHGRTQKVRALLDNASQLSFMTEGCLSKLGLKLYPVSQTIYGIGAAPSLQLKGKTYATIRSSYSPDPQFRVEFFVCPQICAALPSCSFSPNLWPQFANLKLADPNFNSSRPVDMLLSADIFARVICPEKIQTAPNEPVALNSLFGWLLAGNAQVSFSPVGKINTLVSITHDCCISLDKTMQNFWNLEEIPSKPQMSAEDLECEKHFVQTTSVNKEGRYIVELPFILNTSPTFPNSRNIAYRRLLSLENRLSRDPDLRMQYREFMTDYLSSNHMSPAAPLEDPNIAYYIPHHAVLRPESSTSKIRVVFNASQKCQNGVSLNDLLHTGPKLQKDISILLLRFRMHSVVFTADIQQMYRQILVAPTHRNFQRILWRNSFEDPVQEFVLNTVTYGTKPAPFLAQRTLVQLIADKGDQFPLAVDVLENDSFVDDFISGSQNLEQAKLVMQDLIGILKSAGFHLRKWTSNDPDLLCQIPDYDKQLPSSLDFDSENLIVKILGLRWNAIKDCFTYHVQTSSTECTKRTLLSELARIFDPLGLLSPITFFAKHMIQLLWASHLDWDDSPSEEVVAKWSNFKKELSLLSNLEIPRYVQFSSSKSCEVFAFCDASERGYGSCIYLRIVDQNSDVAVSLIIAKSKVAPIKQKSIPRLELCAAVLLTKLVNFVRPILSPFFAINRIVAFSDSQVTLAWLRSPPNRWKTFVGNRVAYIQENMELGCWNYIPSADNPADLASRGCMPSQLLDSSLWWAGPSFLKDPQYTFEHQERPTDPEMDENILLEEKKVVLAVTVESNFLLDLINKFSSLEKIKHIVAYIIRFISLLKRKEPLRLPFTSLELNVALKSLVRAVQHQVFSDEIASLSSGTLLPKPFRRLCPFLDEENLLRVGGRLIHSKLGYDKKFPLLLPSSHTFTNLVIEHFHKSFLHPGLRTLQFLVSQHFWILCPRRAIRKVVQNCVKCFRLKPSAPQPIMGNLPAVRISQAKAFSCTGVDFGGPFLIKSSPIRNAKVLKGYLCLFVCFSTKAIHLELASDLSSECFLAALRRFIARRGRCSQIFSDNATNFVGAQRQLSEMMREVVIQEKISWSFSPPVTPHFNGLIEAGIKSVKSYLRKVIGEQVLTFEEFYTVLVQIEAILNSRPLIDISSDPNDFSALTPGHFLTLEPLSVLPDPDLSHLKLSHLSRWQLLQRIHQDFWKRWHLEYLNGLMERTKWTSKVPNLQLNDLVLLKEDNLPPLQWKLGRILSLHPGSDGVNRVATVKTSSGIFKRGVVKLCPLPKFSQ